MQIILNYDKIAAAMAIKAQENKKTGQKDSETDGPTLTETTIDQMTKLSTAAFGLVAALAWNSAVQGLVDDLVNSFNKFSPHPISGVPYKFVYAIIITLIVVLVTYQLSKISSRIQKKKNDN